MVLNEYLNETTSQEILLLPQEILLLPQEICFLPQEKELALLARPFLNAAALKIP